MILSLFPGIGILDMAFEEEGFQVVRGPDVLWGGDIRRFHPPAGKFDGVIGGPPCQIFSSLSRLVIANGHKPKFGNLIPEFERCVREAAPDWFLMENVPAAPLPVIEGYSVTAFLLDNSALAGEGGFGQEQRRVRRFSFGLRGRQAPNLYRWLDMAVFLLPDASETLTQWTPDNSQEAKGRTRRETICGAKGEPPSACDKRRTRTVTLLGPEHLEGLSKSTTKYRRNAVTAATSQNEGCLGTTRARHKALSSSNGGNGSQRNTPGAGNNSKGRYRLADALRLQGLPADFLADAPFTVEGKLRAVANGVAMPTGRAIARAVKECLDDPSGVSV